MVWTVVLGLGIAVFLWQILKPVPTPINGVYRQPGNEQLEHTTNCLVIGNQLSYIHYIVYCHWQPGTVQSTGYTTVTVTYLFKNYQMNTIFVINCTIIIITGVLNFTLSELCTCILISNNNHFVS